MDIGDGLYIGDQLMLSAGAGKTTVFRMLTGDLSVSSGTARIAGFDIVTDLRKVRAF